MPILTAAVVFTGALSLLNLLFTYGVIRRLRQHSEQLSKRPVHPANDQDEMLPIGSVAGEFTVTADDGTVVTPASFERTVLVAFFSPGCPPCKDLLPTFAEAAAVRGRQGHVRAIAVVAEGAGVRAYRDELSPVAMVIGGDEGVKLATAFGVVAFPSVCTVGPGAVITARGQHLLTEAALVAA